MTANDLEIAVETGDIAADVKESGSVALDAKLFFEIVRKLPDAQVLIRSDENNVTVIKCQKAQFKILGMPGEEFPALPEVEKTKYASIKANELKNMVKRTVFAVSADDSKPVLTGELIEINKGELNIVAVDGYRVALCQAHTSGDGVEDAYVVIPAKTLSEICRILPSEDDLEVKLWFTKNHALAETGGPVVVSRLLEGDFIKYKQLFTEGYNTKALVDRMTFLMCVERASLIASREIKKNPVKIKIDEGVMSVSSFTEIGDFYDEIDIRSDGPGIEISFNPRFIIDALKTIDDENVALRFTTPLSPCVITGDEDLNVKHLILPLRFNG
jgi:DNA polymerase-3 subunit beta